MGTNDAYRIEARMRYFDPGATSAGIFQPAGDLHPGRLNGSDGIALVTLKLEPRLFWV
jgi:hypothetical protein